MYRLYYQVGTVDETIGTYRWEWQAYCVAFYMKMFPAINPFSTVPFFLEKVSK